MSKSVENNYSGDQFLDAVDEVYGWVETLGDQVGNYVDTLGIYIKDETSGSALEREVDDVVYLLERTYGSLDSLDAMIEDENMVARIEQNGRRGFCNLEENLAEFSNGAYRQINSFRDALTLLHYVEEGDVNADLGAIQGGDVGAPTQLIADRDRLEDISQALSQEHNRIIFAEILARRHTEKDESLEPYSPEPPIFQMLGHEEHSDRVNRLNKEFKKNNSLYN